MIHKACPVVLHPDGVPLRLPLLHHPQAGPQLIKGTIENGEDPSQAAARELFEEAGLTTLSTYPLGQEDQIAPGENWHFVLCRVKPPVRDRWQHLCKDDGGHLFKFTWHPLADPAPEMHMHFTRALAWIRTRLT